MKKFNVGIKGVIIKDNRVLIMRTPEASDAFWEMPGGRIDANEEIKETLERELKEELLNIKNIKVGEIVGAWRVDRDIGPDLGLVLIFFRVTADFDGDPEISEEHSAWKWATKKEALNMVHENCHEAINNAYERKIT